MAKRAMALIFVLILSLNICPMAAIVSDNDGSSFVTKAEFEAMKASFAQQVTDYEDSITNKIDGAIASYLAGITVTKEVELNNIYQKLGGAEIRWAWPNIDPTVEPVTGWAGYGVNSGCNGYIEMSKGALYSGIQSQSHWRWWTAGNGNGTLGRFLTYDYTDSIKYLSSFQQSLLEAYFMMGWYSWNPNDLTWDQPFGEKSTSIDTYDSDKSLSVGTPLVTGTKTGIDTASSMYRRYDNLTIDLSKIVCPWNIGTSNIVSISTDDIKKVRKWRRTEADQTVTGNIVKRNETTTTTFTMKATNIHIRDWNCNTSDKYTNLCPGFYNGKSYTAPKIYQGVTYFEGDEKYDGTVKIKKFKLDKIKETSDTDDYVYFAIASDVFDNSAELISTNTSGGYNNIELKTKGTVVDYDATKKIYKVKSGDVNTISFEIEKGKTYYIKMQSSTTIKDYNTSTKVNSVTMTSANQTITFSQE